MNQSPERDPSEVISIVEHRMESLLVDFFRAEMPSSLRDATVCDVKGHSLADSVSLQISQSQPALIRSFEHRSTTGRFAVFTSLALLLISAVLLPTENRRGQSSGDSVSSELLPVSSEAGTPAASGRVIGPNGLTIEETDGIEIHSDFSNSESRHLSPRSK